MLSLMSSTIIPTILRLFIFSYILGGSCQAWKSKRYYYEERYCLNEKGGFFGTPPQTVRNFRPCPTYCARCEFLHPSNSIWCVQQYIGEPEKVYTESYQDDRLVAMSENEKASNASCIERQKEFTQLLHSLTGNERATCNMVHRDGVGDSYFYVCWTGNYRRSLRGGATSVGRNHTTNATTFFESYDDGNLFFDREFDWKPLRVADRR
ncbi:hypothetical protein ACA910_015679 [Epithemia clementina (nom. ined.)]